MSNKNMNAKVKVNFTKASTRQNITSGENISTSFGKISKYLDDLGTAAFTNSSDYATITDLSNKVDKVTGKELMPSDLLDANGDVALSHLPDIVLGQMIYGGTVNASNVATLSTNAKTKLGTTSNTITLTNNTTAITGYVANEGIYYIATGNATLANLGIKTGDWLLSTGSAWSKIDNTDEVSSVNSKTGAVTLNASDVSAVSTSANQGLTDTQKANARTNIGAGTSSFDGDYNSLSNTPSIPPAVAVKGNAETNYRTGNVNLTPANIGAATTAQGTKADSAVQTIKMNGNAVTKTSGVVDLGTVITAHQDISGKADKSATVSNVTYDTTNKKLTKTINGTTSDIVTTAKLKTDMVLSKSDVGLSNVGNFKAVSTAASQGLTDTEKANARTNIGAGTSSFSGSYNDLSNKPTIPTVNNGTLTIQKNGTNVATFTANQSGNATANITLAKADVGLTNVDNTSDANKPISTAAQAVFDKQQAQIDYNTNNGVKNLLKITGVSATKNGVTFTVDKASGTITANGTATAPTSFDIYIDNSHSCPFNGYILTGCPTGGSGTTYDLRITDIDRTSMPEYGSGRIISLTSTGKWAAAILIRDGQTVSNLVFKPMIRDASIADDTFEPYAESNSKLTQKVDKALEQTGYNLFKLTNQIITTNNVTFNVDGATGTITATRTGTQTVNAYLNLDVPDTVYGKMCLSGCADGGNANTYSVYPWDATTGARPKNWEGTANAETSISTSDYVEVNYVQGHTNRITIRITPTASFTSLTFTPMIVPEALAGIQFQPYAKSNVELTQKALLRDDNNNLYYTGSSINEVNIVPAGNMYLTSYGRADVSGLHRAHLGAGTTDTPGYVAIDATNNSDIDAIYISEDSSGNYISIDKDRIKMGATGGNALLSMRSKSFKLGHPNSASSLYYSIECNENFGITLHTSALPITLDSLSFICLSSQSGISFNNITMPYANNAGFHNSIYRGKNLGTSYTSSQKAEVRAGTFDDLFIGDYWTINGINWRIAHFDYYLNTGDTQCTKHHIVVVPDTNITTSYMNSTDITTNAYVGSYMYTTTLLQDGTEADSSVFGKIKAAFGESNLLSIRQIFSNAVDSSGNVSGWSWYDTRCFLMNQSQVYGQKAWPNGNNDGYNVGIDKNQLALFAHDTSTINRRYTYWLRDVRGSTAFALVAGDGVASNYFASFVFGVRPVALLS